MSHPVVRTDRTGAEVTVELVHGRPVSAYRVRLADERLAGHADLLEHDGERIFFHTEVDRDLGGRGLAGILLEEALADSIRDGVVVVPICPLLARHLRDHGDDFAARGGRTRRPQRADADAVAAALQHHG